MIRSPDVPDGVLAQRARACVAIGDLWQTHLRQFGGGHVD